ncbi:hypothetical protein [Paenibacillus sp. y28]|uniref:hypothetical protein n=1 Tax=Paenibacillus sp. y28 TaxID=3129110 RepID=UPI003016148E
MQNSLLLMFLLILLVAVVAVIMTFRVGMSRENKEGNPTYDYKTRGNFVRLTWLYVIGSIVCIGILLWVIYR